MQRDRETNRGSGRLNLKLMRDAWHSLLPRFSIADVDISLVIASGWKTESRVSGDRFYFVELTYE